MNMPLNIEPLVRKNILELQPYTSARNEFSGNASIFLDANENPFGDVLGADDYTRYPDPLQWQLKEKIAALKNVPVERIFIGNGSDEAIDLAYRIFCEPGKDKAIVCPPTYGMYSVSAQINNVEVVRVSLTADFFPDVKGIMSAANEGAKLLFLCSPNNPTGNCMPRKDTAYLLEHFPGMVIIDEAYADFMDDDSWLTKLDQYPNLIVLQTLSKAWGMAALRLGTAFAAPEVINWFNKVKPPYNINGASQQIALEALEDSSRVIKWTKEIIAQRTWLSQQLSSLPFVRQVYPSDANFLLVKVEDANSLYRYLSERGIIVRNRTKEPGCTNCLRITVGTPLQNQQLIKIIQQYEY